MTEKNNDYHIPVMLSECLEGLNINPDGVYVDVTFGGGGHSRAIFEKLSPKGKLIAFDQDKDALNNVWKAPNFHFVQGNFSFLKNHLKVMGIKEVDGILADLGVSSHQFDAGERGFSIRTDDVLDMRMNQKASISAKTVVNENAPEDLAAMFYRFSDLKKVRLIVTAIERARSNKTIETTGELMEILRSLAPKFKENKFFAQVFQAIRIEVNQEMKVLEELLLQTDQVLKPGGRLVVMSYHSLEDRLVKNYVKRGSFDGVIEKDFFGNILKPYKEITRHPLTASEEEIERNSRARSSKLKLQRKMSDNEFTHIDKEESTEKKASRKSKKGARSNPLMQIVNGEFLGKEFVVNNLPFIFYLVFLLVMLVSKGYYDKQLTKDVERMQRDLDETLGDYVSAKAQMEKETTRKVLVEELAPIGLKETVNPTKVIRIEKN